MDAETRTACLTALWILHGGSLAGLLRSHGERDQARNLELALQTISSILGDEMGSQLWREAMDWASDRILADGEAPASPSQH
jgi:hypothetical protein